jgi:hypothetical protein
MGEIDFSKALPPEERQELAKTQGFDLEKAKIVFGNYIKEVDDLVDKANDLTIETEEQNQLAVIMGTSAKKLAKTINQKRDEILKDPEDYVKGVRNFCRMFTEKLATIENGLKQKLTSYRIVQEQKRREAEQKAIAETERLNKKLAKDAEKKGIEAPQIMKPVLPKEQKAIRTESGVASGRKTWTFELADLGKVPREYMTLDERKVNDAIKAGLRNIPGLRIYEKETTTFRTI